MSPANFLQGCGPFEKSVGKYRMYISFPKEAYDTLMKLREGWFGNEDKKNGLDSWVQHYFSPSFAPVRIINLSLPVCSRIPRSSFQQVSFHYSTLTESGEVYFRVDAYRNPQDFLIWTTNDGSDKDLEKLAQDERISTAKEFKSNPRVLITATYTPRSEIFSLGIHFTEPTPEENPLLYESVMPTLDTIANSLCVNYPLQLDHLTDQKEGPLNFYQEENHLLVQARMRFENGFKVSESATAEKPILEFLNWLQKEQLSLGEATAYALQVQQDTELLQMINKSSQTGLKEAVAPKIQEDIHNSAVRVLAITERLRQEAPKNDRMKYII